MGIELELVNLMWNWNWPNGIDWNWNWQNGIDPRSGYFYILFKPLFKLMCLGMCLACDQIDVARHTWYSVDWELMLWAFMPNNIIIDC